MELTELKGVGEKTAALFNKMGINSAEELLNFFPRDYEIYDPPLAVSEIGRRSFAAVSGAFSGSVYSRTGGKLKITTGTFRDEAGGQIKVTWFNAPYIKDQIEKFQLYVLRGRVGRKYSVHELNQPKIFKLEEYEKLIGKISPIYSVTKGLSSSVISKLVKQVLDNPGASKEAFSEVIPYEIRDRYSLRSREFAVRNIHFPENEEAFAEAARRLSFEEIFLFILTMKLNEDKMQRTSSVRINKDPRTEKFKTSLPFSLTGAQERVLKEISSDLSSGRVMNRLVQGDVGSGKTIVALLSMMDAAYSGYQSAFMAPTEVLAGQHFETITKYFKAHNIKDIHAALLTGSMTALEKKVVYDALEDGRVQIVVGTHALFQEKVNYENLGLVITDEQHRFGIKQRETLAGKGRTPHMLVMSATPIPRTLALVLYGNMDVSVIDERPANRLLIKNAVIDDSYIDNAYRLIEREVKAGHQAYIICPLVEYSEGLDAQNVTDYTEMLRERLDDTIRIGMLHGQMKSAQKNEIMEKFTSGLIQVLVATTVVEVGVDAPNATVMMIEDADRFGLAQLHQLRGRVGRGAAQSYCIFVCNKKSKEARERLEILKNSNDGFEIASKDLSMRGPGEFMGTRQSGEFNFRCFDMNRDIKIAEEAAEAVNLINSGGVIITPEEESALFMKTTLLKGGIML